MGKSTITITPSGSSKQQSATMDQSGTNSNMDQSGTNNRAEQLRAEVFRLLERKRQLEEKLQRQQEREEMQNQVFQWMQEWDANGGDWADNAGDQYQQG